MATPTKKTPCKFGSKCHRSDCYFAHPTVPSTKHSSQKACRDGAACTRPDCWFVHPSIAAAKPTAKPFSFNPDAFVFAPQQLAEEAEAVDAEPLSNDALAALNPEFAAALAAGEELDEKALYANAVLADAYANVEADVKELDDELTMLDIELEEDN